MGGGSGRPDSPYKSRGLPETLASLNDLRKQDAENRFVNFTVPSGASVFGHRVRVGYARGGKIDKPETGFLGRVQGEAADRRIDFSVIRDVTIADKNATSATLKLTLFPDISGDELLKKRPSYQALKKDYTRSVSLRVALRSAGGDLALTGEEQSSDSDTEPAKLKVIALFKDLPNDQHFDLQEERPSRHPWWWAIDSVTRDDAYPHRIIMKK